MKNYGVVDFVVPNAERFWGYACPEPNTGCWLWTGALYRPSSTRPFHPRYGAFSAIRRSNGRAVTIRAHRASYLLAHEELSDGAHVLHTCDNPPCVNPAHLFLGTHADNVRDMHSKGRWKRINMEAQPRGELHGNAKLTRADVAAIRGLHVDGFSYAEIAPHFNIGFQHVGRIVTRESWNA